MGRHEEKRTPVIRILLTPGEFGPRLQMLLALAMRPERLSPADLRAIHRELAAVRARAH